MAAEADAAARMALLNSLLSALTRTEFLSEDGVAHAAAMLTSRPALLACRESAAGAVGAVDLSRNYMDAAFRTLGRGTPRHQALAASLLAACICASDDLALLERAGAWSSGLADALKRGVTVAMAGGPDTPDGHALVQAAAAAAAALYGASVPLVELPGVRRELSAAVPRLAGALTSLLQLQDAPSGVHCANLSLLAALLQCTPGAVRSSAPALERALQALVLACAQQGAQRAPISLGNGRRVLAQAALCAALLPAAPGGAVSWSETARRLLTSTHDVLDQILLGLEQRPLTQAQRSLLAPAGQAAVLPGSGGGQEQAAAAAAAIGQQQAGWLPSLPWQTPASDEQTAPRLLPAGEALRKSAGPARLLLGFCLSALQHLLQNPAASPVPVPGHAVLLLATRLLRFDAGAALAAGAVAPSATLLQALIALQPRLQAAGWRLLATTAAAAARQLPLQGALLRAARQGLRAVHLPGAAGLAARPPALRCAAYGCAVGLLRSTGMAGVRVLAADVLGCAVLELYGSAGAAAAAAAAAVAAAGGGSANGARRHASAQQPQQRPPAKRRRGDGGGSGGGHLDAFDASAAAGAGAAAAARDDAARLSWAAADLPAQAAALRLLRSLLQAGGQLLTAEARGHADAVAYHITVTAQDAAAKLRQQPGLCSIGRGGMSPAAALAGLQVQAVRALAASLLVPHTGSHRPPFLGGGIEVLRRGAASLEPCVAAACSGALLKVEALLHPRDLAAAAVRGYPGLEDLPPLPRPVLWSAAAPQPPPAACARCAAAPLQPQTTAVQVPRQAAAALAAAPGGVSDPSGGAERQQDGSSSGVVVGIPVNSASGPHMSTRQDRDISGMATQQLQQLQQLQQQVQQLQQKMQQQQEQQEQQVHKQQQQQVQQLQQVQQQQQGKQQQLCKDIAAGAAAPAAAAAAAAAEPIVNRPMHKVAPEPLLQAAVPHESSLAAEAVPTWQGPRGTRGHAVPAGSNVAQAIAQPVPPFVDESSDSEGPLPDIDSGSGSSDNEDGEE